MRWIDRLDDIEPGVGETLIWPVRLTDPQIQRLLASLRPRAEDLAHAAKAKADDRGAGRLARRLLLRALAGRALDQPTNCIQVAQDASGAPGVFAPKSLYASTAGRPGWALLGVGVSPLGVDLETRPPEHPLPLDLLHAEDQSRLRSLEGERRNEAFLRLWTVKEAYAKAASLPIDQVLKQIQVTENAGRMRIGGVSAEVEARRAAAWEAAAVVLA